jgi:two-component system alkaline phosphatase synthesis response regulator PhoP
VDNLATHDTGEAPSVLVIDDEDYLVDLIATTLESEGYQVYLAYNGRDGLERARSAKIDLIITDIMMPYLGGIALMDAIRADEHTRDIPIILISAATRPLQERPKVTFIAKPFDINKMLELVEAQIGKPGEM